MGTSVERDNPGFVQALEEERDIVPGLDDLEPVAVPAGIPGRGQAARDAPVEEIQVSGPSKGPSVKLPPTKPSTVPFGTTRCFASAVYSGIRPLGGSITSEVLRDAFPVFPYHCSKSGLTLSLAVACRLLPPAGPFSFS